MKIIPLSSNQVNNTNHQSIKQQPHFGMKILSMDDAACKVASSIFTLEKFKALLPDIGSIKTRDRKEIYLRIYGVDRYTIKINARTTDGRKVRDVMLSGTCGKSTVETASPEIIGGLIPTLTHIKTQLDIQKGAPRVLQAKIETGQMSPDREQAFAYYKDTFGAKKKK